MMTAWGMPLEMGNFLAERGGPFPAALIVVFLDAAARLQFFKG